jgi:putative transposase
MSRYRLQPTPWQEGVLLSHCAHARYVWNLCIEQESWWRPGRGRMPRLAERCRQLTEARAESPWLAEGSAVVQQQAIRDHDQAMQNFFAGTHRRPTWRRKGEDEGFRIVGIGPGDVRRLNRNWAEVKVPKVGWVRFRWSRSVPGHVKSGRVTRDRAGRWHIAFAIIPAPVEAPRTGDVVGVDRGVTVSAALSTGEMMTVPGLSAQERARLGRLELRLARAERRSARRGKVKMAVARLKAREADRRKDWCEKLSTDLACRFDVIRVEDLKIGNMTRSAKGTAVAPGSNVRQKAPGRVEKVSPAFTSQRCSACGHVDAKSRESQAVFACTACGFACNADVNAARNIAAGHAVTAREGFGITRPVNREPQPLLQPV